MIEKGQSNKLKVIKRCHLYAEMQIYETTHGQVSDVM